MDVDEVQPGRGAPVAEQARLDVLERERLAQQRVVEQVDLADRQVVGRPPVGVQALQLVGVSGPIGAVVRVLRPPPEPVRLAGDRVHVTGRARRAASWSAMAGTRIGSDGGSP